MKAKNQSLFDLSKIPVIDHRVKHRHKHSFKHWTYERRLAYLINHHKYLNWKLSYKLTRDYLDNIHNGERLNHGHLVNQWQLRLGVRAMHAYRKMTPEQRKRSSRSISKIARAVHVSRRTLYRAYHKKYGN